MRYLEAKRLQDEGENKALGGPPENKARGSDSSGPQASVQARQLAKEQNIDLATLTGTGSGGTITAGDVRRAIESRGGDEGRQD